jgi:glycosyltransferase involved in cell wall biosynthesis
MKIGIDARMFGPRVGGGGPGRYVEQLVLNLQKLDVENEYVVFCKRDNFGDIPIPNKRWTKVVADIHWYTLAEQIKLPRIIDKHHLDFIHIPHFNVPLRLKTPFIATVHDLIMLEQPWSARATTKTRLVYEMKRFGFKKTLQHVAKNARQIITVSNHAKNKIIHRLKVSPDRVSVVYNGIDSAVTNSANPAKISGTQDVQKQKSNTGQSEGETSIATLARKPFLLNVGNSYPHKNIETLLHAFSFLLADHPDVSLVLAGPNNVFQERLREEAKEIAIPDDRIFFTGFIRDEELSWLYKNASVYVLPSKVEGFGIPPLEALKLGTPVAASRASCIPEILGEAAVYFHPEDIESLVDAIESLLMNSDLKTKTLAKSHEVLAQYNWKNATAQVLQIYKKQTN